MAILQTEYLLKLTQREAEVLKILLGNMNDDQFAEFGVRGDDRKLMAGLWCLLPYAEEDDSA